MGTCLVGAAVYDQARGCTTAIDLQAILLRGSCRVQLPCIGQIAHLRQVGSS